METLRDQHLYAAQQVYPAIDSAVRDEIKHQLKDATGEMKRAQAAAKEKDDADDDDEDDGDDDEDSVDYYTVVTTVQTIKKGLRAWDPTIDAATMQRILLAGTAPGYVDETEVNRLPR